MAQSYGALKEDNYSAHYRELFLIRIIVCLYVKDT